MKTKKTTIKLASMIFALALFLMFVQGCKVTEAIYETIQESLFAESGHSDASAEAFIHWDEDDPAEVPVSCAKCHSNNGFLDFAADGVVDGPSAPGVFTCDICHTNPETGAARTFASVTFPSGAVIEGMGLEALCMQCHQGRASTGTVDSAIARAGVGDDTPSGSLRFSNIHYFAAAATLYGTMVKGGYQYAGKTYDGKFGHVDGYNACIDCHSPHSLEVKTGQCDTCHTHVKGKADLHDIRYLGSLMDYDGDGNMSEGMYYEIEGMLAKLYSGIQAYAANVVGVPIGYDAHTYPYFIIDTNGNGVIDESEASRSNGYNKFTPRLLKACYNFQVVKKDPGGFAHGGKYLIQLMYDSLEDLNSAMGGAVSMAGMHRNDEGHFDGSSEAWRHWDEDGEVPSGCARCHSATGLADFIENGENQPAHIANGMLCTTCHSGPPALYRVDEVTFPSGEVASLGDSSNLCLICHQGRASKKSIDNAIAGSAGPYGFTNIHYYPVGATLFGSDVHGGYEYAGKVYAGRKIFANHDDKFDTCVECHMGTMGPGGSHNVAHPDPANCVNCHGQDIAQPYPGADPAMFKFSGIRPASIPDYDGDGNGHESIKAEIQGLEAALYAQMQAYGFAIGKPVIYDSHTYPYFFGDKNGNGLVDPGEANYGNRYQFDAKLLKAAYNYQMSLKEPSGYIHNSMYVAQLLVDSIQNLGGNIAPYTWR